MPVTTASCNSPPPGRPARCGHTSRRSARAGWLPSPFRLRQRPAYPAACRISGLYEPEVLLYPAAHTLAPPGVVDAPTSRLAVPVSGLDSVVLAEPFQFMVKVCRVVDPDGTS